MFNNLLLVKLNCKNNNYYYFMDINYSFFRLYYNIYESVIASTCNFKFYLKI